MPEKRRVSISALISIVSVALTGGMFWSTMKTEQRAEQLFGSQVRPLLQEQITGVLTGTTNAAGGVTFDIVNYSGFDASDVRYDFKFGTNDWLVPWVEADARRLEQLKNRTPEEESNFNWYSKKMWRIGPIKAGARRELQAVTGSVNLDTVCKSGKGMEVLSRLIWKNDRGHAFDRIRRFELRCTRVGTGTAFNAVPLGVVAQDE